MAEEKEITLLPSGVTTTLLGRDAYDWPSIKVLAEKGVSYQEIGRHFNGLDPQLIAKKAHQEGWLTPARERKMKKELAKRQAEALAQTGQPSDPAALMEQIWKDRMEHVDEEAYRIVKGALAAVDEARVRDMILEAKDLKTMVDIARKVTGTEKREQEQRDEGPRLALNIGFLRSAGIEDSPVIDV